MPGFTADDMFGFASSTAQPDSMAARAGVPSAGGRDVKARTQPQGATGLLANPTVALVLILGAAAFFVHVSVRGGVSGEFSL